MADRAKFTVQLIDKVSPGAKKASKAVGELNGRFKDAKGKLREANGQFVKGAGAVKLFGMNLNGAMDVFKGNMMTSAARRMMGLGAAAIGASYNMTTFGQNSKLAFDALAKHGAKGEDMFAHARELAKRFGLDVMDTSDAYKKFLSMQFDPQSIDEMIRMGADLRMLGADAEAVQGILANLGKIKGQGRVQGDELLSLAERGVSLELIRAEMGTLLGGKSNEQVGKMITAGKVNADIAIKAIKLAVMKKLNESKLGERGAEFADKTIDGMVGRFKAFGQDAGISMFDKAAAPISKALKSSLDKLISFADSPAGATMIENLAKSIERMAVAGADFGGDLAKKFIEADWAAIGREIGNIAQGMIAAARAGLQLAEALGLVGGKKDGKPAPKDNRASVMGFGAAGAAVGMFAGPLGAVVGGLTGAALAGIENIGLDIADGLLSRSGATTAAHGAGVQIGNSVKAGMVESLEIHSPSRVAARLGEQVGAGLAVGMGNSEGLVSRAGNGLASASMDGMHGAGSPAFSFGDVGASSGTGAFSLNLTQNIQGGGSDAEEIGRIAARETRREVESFFRQLAMEV